MTHKPIQIKNISYSLPHKTCFEDFSYQIHHGSRIAIIGRNGSGKSSLLKIIESICKANEVVGYVPQVIDGNQNLSGGERLNKATTKALSLDPNILLLDEPTNHLDSKNRKSLMRMLSNYQGTMIVVSHDRELLRNCIDTIWHIDNGKVHVFSGDYDDYINEIKLKRSSIESEISFLSMQKKDMHNKIMQQEQRASKSKASGEKKIENRKWLKSTGDSKAMSAEKSQGKKIKNIESAKNNLNNKLSDLRLPEIIIPKFSIQSSDVSNRTIVQISSGSVGYYEGQQLLSGITLSLRGGERISIKGDNGSGKSTLIKCILGDKSIIKKVDWYVIKRENIGYLDQHYSTLPANESALEIMADASPHFYQADLRWHLNDFLFRKNEEVNSLVRDLSGGEKARLSLAQISTKIPELLILDEVTNNLDLETKEHVISVLKNYPWGYYCNFS